MLKKIRRIFVLVLVTALLVGIFPDMTDKSIVYAEELIEADSILNDIDIDAYESISMEENEDFTVENDDTVQFDFAQDDSAQDEVMQDETSEGDYTPSEDMILSDIDDLTEESVEENHEGEEVAEVATDILNEEEQRTLYYETNLKVNALPISNNIYAGQRDIQIATPIFSQDTTNKTVIYLEDDKNQIITNNYGGILGNAYDSESGNLVINIPKNTSSGKHVLTFTAVAPKGCTASKATLTVNIKIGIEDIVIKTKTAHYYLDNKDIYIKPETYFHNATLKNERPGFDYTFPSTPKAIYSLKSDNEELLNYITINPSNGNVKISKELTPVFDSIKAAGDAFKIVAVANDFEGLDEPGDDYLGKDRSAERTFTLSTEGLSERIEKANEMRCFICENDTGKMRTELALTDKDNKTMTSFSIKEAQQLEFRIYDSADASDNENIAEGFIWNVKGPVKKQYDAESIAQLLFATIAKSVLSMDLNWYRRNL